MYTCHVQIPNNSNVGMYHRMTGIKIVELVVKVVVIQRMEEGMDNGGAGVGIGGGDGENGGLVRGK